MFYPKLGLPLALELVNTQFAVGGQPRDALETPADLAEWLRQNRLELESVSVNDLERFLVLRQALRRLFIASCTDQQPPIDDIEMLNEVSAAAPRYPQLEWLGDGPHVHMREHADAHAALLAAVVRSAMEVLSAEDGVGQCQAPNCILLFTRDARHRQWCSAACGNRARVARHYARHKRSSSDEAHSMTTL